MLRFYDEGIGAFTEEELDRLEHYCDGLQLAGGRFNNAVDDIKRECGLGERDIMDKTGVSHHTFGKTRSGKPISPVTLRKVVFAATQLKDRFRKTQSETENLIAWAQDAMIEVGGRNAFARLLEIDASYLGRVLAGQKPLSDELRQKFRDLKKKT